MTPQKCCLHHVLSVSKSVSRYFIEYRRRRYKVKQMCRGSPYCVCRGMRIFSALLHKSSLWAGHLQTGGTGISLPLPVKYWPRRHEDWRRKDRRQGERRKDRRLKDKRPAEYAFSFPILSKDDRISLSASTIVDVEFTFYFCIGSQSKQNPSLGNAIPVLGMHLKRGKCVFWYFFNIDLYSATSIESSHRELLNGMAEHRPILKNNQNTYHAHLVSHPNS